MTSRRVRPVNRATLELPNQLQSVPTARAVTQVLLGGWRLAPEVVDDAALLVTELASNAVRHGDGDLTVNVADQDGAIRVSVHDDGATLPQQAAADFEQECGRGLFLVDAVAARWGTQAAPVGKSVWFELTHC